MTTPSISEVDQLISSKRGEWMDLEGVEGVGRSENHGVPTILVMTSKPDVELPDQVDGIQIEVRFFGKLNKQ